MEVGLAYWTLAFFNMLVAVGCAVEGMRRARRRRLDAHRRLMRACVVLVALFLVSYVAKTCVLGREDLARWSDSSVLLLRVHESFVLAMLIGGGAALWLARRWRAQPALRAARLRLYHRAAGRVAIAAAVLGLLTAGLVLRDMHARPGSETSARVLGDEASPAQRTQRADLARAPGR